MNKSKSKRDQHVNLMGLINNDLQGHLRSMALLKTSDTMDLSVDLQYGAFAAVHGNAETPSI